MFRKFVLAIFLVVAAFSAAHAEGVWRHDGARGWHYGHHGQNFYWIAPTMFQPAAYYWWNDLELVWVPVEREAFYAVPFATSYGYYSPYPGWYYDRGGKWRRDDKRGTHDWDRGDWRGHKHTDAPPELPKKARIAVPQPKEPPKAKESATPGAKKSFGPDEPTNTGIPKPKKKP